MTPTPWVREPDGLERRSLSLRFRLLHNLKGRLRVAPGSVFEIKVPQERENALTVSDYHGFWSHNEPRQGQHYLVVSNGSGEDPAPLLEEPAIQDLADARLANDVRLADAAEERWGSALRPETPAHQRRRAAAELLQYAYENRAAAQRLFAGYVWARVRHVYATAPEALSTQVFAIVSAADASIPLRQALINGSYEELIARRPAPEDVRKMLRVLLGLLQQKEAAPLFDRLLQSQIYNLLFQFGGAEARPADVVPDAADRAHMIAVIGRFTSQRAGEVRKWLMGG